MKKVCVKDLKIGMINAKTGLKCADIVRESEKSKWVVWGAGTPRRHNKTTQIEVYEDNVEWKKDNVNTQIIFDVIKIKDGCIVNGRDVVKNTNNINFWDKYGFIVFNEWKRIYENVALYQAFCHRNNKASIQLFLNSFKPQETIELHITSAHTGCFTVEALENIELIFKQCTKSINKNRYGIGSDFCCAYAIDIRFLENCLKKLRKVGKMRTEKGFGGSEKLNKYINELQLRATEIIPKEKILK